MQCSWLSSYIEVTLASIVYEPIILKTWGINHNKTLSFYYCSFSIYFFLFLPCFLLFLLFIYSSFLSYPHLIYSPLLIVYSFSFFFFVLSLPIFSHIFFFSIFSLAAFFFFDFLLSVTLIFVFVNLATLCYSPLSVSTILLFSPLPYL